MSAGREGRVSSPYDCKRKLGNMTRVQPTSALMCRRLPAEEWAAGRSHYIKFPIRSGLLVLLLAIKELAWRKGSFPKSCAMAEFHQHALPRCTWLSYRLAGPNFILTQPLLVHRHGLGVAKPANCHCVAAGWITPIGTGGSNMPDIATTAHSHEWLSQKASGRAVVL